MAQQPSGVRQFIWLIQEPKRFFANTATAATYGPTLLYYASFGISVAILQTLTTLPAILDPATGIAKQIEALIGFILSLLFVFLAPFIVAGMMHLGVITIGGTKGYRNTFNPAAYALVVGTLYNAVAACLWFGFYLGSPALMRELLLSEQVSNQPLQVAYLASVGVVGLVGLCHSLYVASVGIASFQKVTMRKAVLAVLFVPLLLLLALSLASLLVG